MVGLTVFDLAGRRVRSLVDERMPAGPHAMFWDGRGQSGQKLGSGVYMIKLAINGKVVATRRATLVR
jgi:flagellar hook assembly protein FlgD